MTDVLRDIITRNRAGERAAIVSVCSAQPDVLRASIAMAERLDRQIVVEATSNQVNQEGGYTGITPSEFIGYVHGLAETAGADRARITFGGDHLGPQAWRALDADAAMAKADVLVRDYVAAGFGKIHLDCSEGCAGDPAQLGDDITAERSARLARMCCDAGDDLLFVVGTEVPPPGGARMDEHGDIPPTHPADARATLAAHDAAFGDMAGLIGGLVVQPGVEFSPTAVHAMPLDRDPGLLDALRDHPQVCLEAHSTDYQDPAVFPRLADLGFAFQKVGPALTFAYREALYALDQLRDPACTLKSTMESVMLANPSQWQGHYSGDGTALYQQRHFGLADRIRYYWPHKDAQAAVTDLLASFKDTIPDDALNRVFNGPVLERAEALNGSQVQRLIDAQIEIALDPYFFEDTP
ncbi:class II D-tagatose-bisphosphate aldolase, non-catalytic subunit [Octadecabacter sp. G9-8]|uniref:Class II D-tagatose-bisphosphate aldolase, non-catalytic subunit n=1 Tax=Octadecabacter dasysiphoniae TaxID=2909341 RepID=A0ABS9CWA9_9RHOB|nr:class II D-tagatose-bisphosphate aldolase, non-catalytic subunit [Octadecabacter dasysiphoniae]MCF2870659.1 class II D-tagatose-bisphosphate aldolase, non-catalytic subunit [Octadecabacter dasysiphoniae]